MIFLGIPFLNREDLLHESIKAIDIPCDLIIVNNGGLEIESIDNDSIKRTTIFNPSYNLGVARSWNLIIEEGRSRNVDRVFIGSNDTIVERGSLKRAEKIIREDADHDMWHLNGYNLFCMNFNMFDVIGRFDENFYPAYKEDQDYDYRIRKSIMKNRVLHGIEGVNSRHLGSMTIRSNGDYLRQNSDTHKMNYDYYLSKWGGDAGSEKWDVPFDGKDSVKRDTFNLQWK
jgi:GT2 family glycosyltransferase